MQNAIKAGANPNASGILNETALMKAAEFNNNPEVITALIKGGADVNAKNSLKETALMKAAEFNTNPEVITALIKGGAIVNAKNSKGATALNKNIEVFKELVRIAEQGHVEVQYQLGLLYWWGVEGAVAIDRCKAMELFRKAAELSYNEEPVVRNVKWGMTPEEVMNTENAQLLQRTHERITYRDNLLGEQCTINYFFACDGLERVEYTINSKAKSSAERIFNDIANTLEKKHPRNDKFGLNAAFDKTMRSYESTRAEITLFLVGDGNRTVTVSYEFHGTQEEFTQRSIEKLTRELESKKQELKQF